MAKEKIGKKSDPVEHSCKICHHFPEGQPQADCQFPAPYWLRGTRNVPSHSGQECNAWKARKARKPVDE